MTASGSGHAVMAPRSDQVGPVHEASVMGPCQIWSSRAADAAGPKRLVDDELCVDDRQAGLAHSGLVLSSIYSKHSLA
jgi:hypothetical protein